MATAPASWSRSAQPATPDVAPMGHTLEYAGATGTLFSIFFRNLGLTIITLGIYRFWAKTRTRRFLWSSTEVDGEPFEYTGTGKELFIGFLKAVAVLVPVFAAVQLAQLWFAKEPSWLAMTIQYLQTFAIVVLIYAGSYAARRYRMSRTLWRGIRFHQTGSAWRYVGHALLGLFLCAITLGFYFPYFQTRMLRYEVNNLRFGTARFRFTGAGRELLGRFVLCWLLGIVIFALLSALLGGAIALALKSGLLNPNLNEPGASPNAIATIVAIGAAVYLAIGLTFLIVGTWYQAKVWRFRAAHTQCEGLRFAMPDVSAGKLMRLLVGNWFLGIVSFGLLTPLVMQRSMRFWCRHLAISGAIDLDAVAQADGGPRAGEGLTGFFDVDVG